MPPEMERTAGGHAEYATPHLDRLAREGVVLDRYYVNQLCSPTRTSLVSSRYAYNLGLAGGVITNGHAVHLRLNESSIGQHFKALGMRTHAFGKWDVGMTTKYHTPTYRGFDTFVGYYNADEDYLTHSCGGCGCPAGLDLHDDHSGNLKLLEDNTTYSTVLYTAAIIEQISKSPTCPGSGVAGLPPFFLYAAYQAVHGPLEAPQQHIDECKQDGVVEESAGGNRLIFCGMVKALDEGVGNITAKLTECGLDSNTVIALTADNGGQNKVGGNNWPLRGNKATLFQGGVRGTGFVWGKMLAKPGRLSSVMMHNIDWGPTLISAAGGDGAALAKNTTLKLDGVDCWDAIALTPVRGTGERPSCAILYEDDHFTKTGSGQT
jgi:arylsulfatase B